MPVEERVSVLEQRTQHMEQRALGLGDSVVRVENKIDQISETLRTLVRIEERQGAIVDRLTAGSQTMQEQGKRIQALEVAMPDELDKRLVAIETKMPGLVESRKWVVMGVLGGLAMMGAAVVHTVLKG